MNKPYKPSQMSEAELTQVATSFISAYEAISSEEKEMLRLHCCGQCAFCTEPKLDRPFSA